MRQVGWSWDIYRGKIILWGKYPRWATLRDDIISIVPGCLPNEHDCFLAADMLNQYLDGARDNIHGLQRALDHGFLTLGNLLLPEECQHYRYIR